jgi:methyl-accepting chemotaxis protein
MNDNFAIVDQIGDLTGDTVTIFQGDTRVATNVKKASGDRAVGTQAAENVIAATLKRGETYIGKAVVVGTWNQTAYKPIKNSKGEIIGMWYVGVPHTHYAQVVKAITFKIIVFSIAGLLIVFSLGIYLIYSITRPIHWVVEGLTEGAEQVSSASGQISRASQHVAQGASEQASGIEEVSSSLEEIASITKQNSDNAQQAKVIMNEASQIIKNTQFHMGQMGQAIGEITVLSEETSKIIKTIDEVAFQTNLLALNAAVEAARAGEAGAGFSVVANEVRNLAMKASEAAKNTSQLIENTIKAVKNGKDLAQTTRDTFEEITGVAMKHARLTDDIAVASQEQAQGIEQVATAVAQMNQVTQASAAGAEESASAGEELNAQAAQVNSMIQELLAIVGGSNGAHHGGSRVAHKARQVVGKLHHTAAGLLHHGPEENRVQVTAPPLKQKQSRPKKVTVGKRTAHKSPEELIPFREGKEKDEEVLREF